MVVWIIFVFDILKVGRWNIMCLLCLEECSFYVNIILIYYKIVISVNNFVSLY